MKKVARRQSLFFRLLTVFLGIVTVFFLTGLGIYNWGIKTIRQEIIGEACIQNRNFTNDLDRELKRIITLQYELADNWDLMRLSTPLGYSFDDYEKSNMMLRIQEKLNAIKTSSRFVDDIQVVIPEIKKAIGTINVGDLSEDEVWLLNNYPTLEQRQLLYQNDSLLLVAEYPPLYYSRGLEPYYLIYAKIPPRLLTQFLNEITVYKQGYSFLLSESRQMLVTNGDQKIAEEIRNQIADTDLKPVRMSGNIVPHTYVQLPKVFGKRYIVVYTDTGVQDLSLVRYIPEKEAFAGLAPYQALIWLFGFIAAFLAFLFGRSLYSAIHSPLKKLVSAFRQLQDGDFSVTIQDKRTDEFQYIYNGFNEMVGKLDNLIDQVYKQRLLAEKAKLKQLQSQINPHFLYNSFLILSNRIELGENEYAAEFCREIGSYFLFVTRSNKDFVPFRFEVNHAVTYANIQRARFSDRVKMEFACLPEEYEEIFVPRLILQPILENAFEHTLENMESGGYLKLSYQTNGELLDIVIEDNGSELSDETLTELSRRLDQEEIEATGIINIHRRLKLVYPEGCGLLLGRSCLGGLKVTVRISLNGCIEPARIYHKTAQTERMRHKCTDFYW